MIMGLFFLLERFISLGWDCVERRTY